MQSSDCQVMDGYTLSQHDALPICYSVEAGPIVTYFLTRRMGSKDTSEIQRMIRSEEHTSELQSLRHLVCSLRIVRLWMDILFPNTTLFRSATRWKPDPL